MIFLQINESYPAELRKSGFIVATDERIEHLEIE